jgi:hypothetical protein
MQIRRVTVHRGSHLPKRKGDSNHHPTYEISVCLSFSLCFLISLFVCSLISYISLYLCMSQVMIQTKDEEIDYSVRKFFCQCRDLHMKITQLLSTGKEIPSESLRKEILTKVEDCFPPTYTKSSFGIQLTEPEIQERFAFSSFLSFCLFVVFHSLRILPLLHYLLLLLLELLSYWNGLHI